MHEKSPQMNFPPILSVEIGRYTNFRNTSFSSHCMKKYFLTWMWKKMIQYFLESRYAKNLYIFSSVLGPWSEWSQCSVTCGGGKQRRNRECGLPKTRSNQNNPCLAPLSEEQNCNDKNCPILTPWTDWSDCSKTCGGGYR